MVAAVSNGLELVVRYRRYFDSPKLGDESGLARRTGAHPRPFGAPEPCINGPKSA